jgi:hypothetical protein
MSQSTESRVVLAVTITAVAMSIVWIFSEISAESPTPEHSVWRYTSQGWQEMIDMSAPPVITSSGPLDHVSPLVWGAILMLAGILILVSFANDSWSQRSKEKRLQKLALHAVPIPKHTRRTRTKV